MVTAEPLLCVCFVDGWLKSVVIKKVADPTFPMTSY